MLTRGNIAAAFVVAGIADLLQLPLSLATLTGIGALPAEGADLVVDGITAFILYRLLGFHWVLLPTAFLEAMPLVDAAPTWLACVAFVVWSKRREAEVSAPPPSQTIVDVTASSGGAAPASRALRDRQP